MPPVNDNFVDAIAISTSLPQTITGQTTVNSTNEVGEPAPYFGLGGTDVSHSVWYTFTPTHDAPYRFRVYNTGTIVWTDVKAFSLGVYTGSAVNSLTAVDTTFGNSSFSELAIRAHLTSGVTYRIQVSSPSFTGEGANAHSINFDLDVSEITSPGIPPANDDIADAEDLGLDPEGTFSGSNIDATYEAWEGSAGYSQPSVWYKFSIDFTATQTVLLEKTGSDPDWQPYAEIYTVNNDPPAGFSDLSFFEYLGNTSFTGTVGSTDVDFVPGDYYLVVYNWNFDGSWDDFDLTFQEFSLPPANDNFSNRTVLQESYRVSITGTTAGATIQFSEPTDNPGGVGPHPSVWYEWTAPNYNNTPMNFQIDTLGSTAETYLEVFTGTSIGGLTRIVADHNSGAGGKSQLTLNAVGNTVYKIRVASPASSVGTFNLNITAQAGGSPPPNDNFVNAELVTGYSDSASGTTVDATAEADEQTWDGLFDQGEGSTTNTVWYKWVPPQTGRVRVEFDSGGGSLSLQMARGTTLANLQEVQFFAISSSGSPNYDYITVEGGVDYYFIIYGNGGSENTFTFSFYMENIAIPTNNDPSTPTIIPYVNGTSTITDDTRGSYFDTVGPDIGDFVTNADELSTLWYKITPSRHGYISISVNNDVVYNNDATFDAIVSVWKGDTPATATRVGKTTWEASPSDSIAALESGETYWILVESFYWSTTLSWDYTIQIQDEREDGISPDPVNGTSDFDSITGGFVADDDDGVFVASGGVGYGTIIFPNGHWVPASGPGGWWARFEVESTSGDYLYRFGQTQQFIEIFRATREDNTYESICVVGSKTGVQTIAYYQNGVLRYDTGHAAWGAHKYGSSSKIRIEVGANGLTIDGVNFFIPSDEGFVDTIDNQFTQFDFGIITYPGDGTSYVDLDPEWNIRISDLTIHDNPEINVMGPFDQTNPEITSFYGWTTGDLIKHDTSDFQFDYTGSLTTEGAPIVDVSAGEYSDGYSLIVDVPDVLHQKSARFSISQPTDSIVYDPYGDPAYDTYYPGYSFRFYIHDNFPDSTTLIAYHLGTDSEGTQGWKLFVGDDGTLYIQPSQQSGLIPFCYVNINEWTYIEIQWDCHIRPYACKIWMQNSVYIGRFEENVVFNPFNMDPGPSYLGQYALTSNKAMKIEFRDVSTTRCKHHRPLGPTIVVGKHLNGVGEHYYPELPDEGTLPVVTDIVQNGDFSGATDGAGQPAYWTSYDRFDSPIPPGAMILDYLGQVLADSICSLVTDTTGPPGFESSPTLRIEAVANDQGYEEGNAVGFVVGNGADVTYPLAYADTISMQFWIKGKAGWQVSCYGNSGIGTLDAFQSFPIEEDDEWQFIRTFMTPQVVTAGTLNLTSIILQIDGMSVGDFAYVKETHIFINQNINDVYGFYQTTDNGTTIARIPFDDVDSWKLIDEFPPTIRGDHIYANFQTFRDRLRGSESDGKTHLPPLNLDYYLEYTFQNDNPPKDRQLFAAKFLLQCKDFSGGSFTSYGNSGPVYVIPANEDGDYRSIGGRRPAMHINDPDEKRFGITLRRPPGLGRWGTDKWNSLRMRFGFHHKLFGSLTGIIADFSNAGVLEGAYAELLIYDRKLPPPNCIKPVDLSRIRFRAYQDGDA